MGLLSSLGKSMAKRAAREVIKNEVRSAISNSGNSGSSANDTYTSSAMPSSTKVLSSHPSKYYKCDVTTENAYNYVAGENNLYDYNGTWNEYFMDIFTRNFPDYQIVTDYRIDDRTKADFALMKEGKPCVCVEVYKCSTRRYALCQKCHQRNIGYAGFVLGHAGWWNTERYVTDRIKSLL